MTIHKVQGQTLDKVKIDLGNKRPKYGIATVALTRTKRIDDILLESFNFDHVFSMNENSKYIKQQQKAVLHAMKVN